ncbi:MAG: acyl-CoA dehydrogenase N-terminal domain-containing protein, partial [Arenimonas sp.]|nr:acyl-CoA dehydrogenase N-terminal domain-containing protein [Arenimonas sp.]
MNTYKAPLNDMKFVLFDVLNAEKTYTDLEFNQADRELLDAVLEEAAKFAETVLAPINGSADEEGCHHEKST